MYVHEDEDEDEDEHEGGPAARPLKTLQRRRSVLWLGPGSRVGYDGLVLVALIVAGCGLAVALVILHRLRGRLVRRATVAADAVELRVPLWFVLVLGAGAVLATVGSVVMVFIHFELEALGAESDVPSKLPLALLVVLAALVLGVLQFAWRVRVDASGISGHSFWLQRRFAIRWSEVRALRRTLGGSWVLESAGARVVIPGSADGVTRFAMLALEHLTPQVRASAEEPLRRAAGARRG